MIKKSLYLFVLTLFCFSTKMSAQSFTNLVFESTIAPTATTVSLTFDYSGISTGDVFEWQLFLAQGDGTPDWGSGRNIAYLGPITPNSTGSGTQTINLDIYGSPVDGEVFTWTGKITLGADGSDTGYNNAGNLVTVSSTASTEDINANGIVVYPNPVSNNLNIKASLLQANTITISDVMGRTVKVITNAKNISEINVSSLTNGLYILTTDTRKQFKFLKQ